jgi:hypothetical protein
VPAPELLELEPLELEPLELEPLELEPLEPGGVVESLLPPPPPQAARRNVATMVKAINAGVGWNRFVSMTDVELVILMVA